MDELHEKLLNMFHWFDSFCRENDLAYYMVAGTMLGAVRHQGFIPWDDDVDVAMPREAYDKFRSLMQNRKNTRYVAETVLDNACDYPYPYMKIYDTQTTLIENTRKQLKRGIFIDVFPLEGLGDSEQESRKNYLKIRKWIILLRARVCVADPKRSFLKNAVISLAHCIPSFLCKDQKLLYAIEQRSKKLKYEDCSYVGILAGGWGYREVMPKAILGTPTEYEFEGYRFLGVENDDAYLTRLYGNYMELPPIEKRVTHHDYIYCNLKEPFKDISE